MIIRDNKETIASIVDHALKAQELTVSAAARKWQVHRNFLIDLRTGKVPRMCNNHKHASSDKRYSLIAKGIGIDPVEFCAIADHEQSVAYDHSNGLVEARPEEIIIRLSLGTVGLAPISMIFELGGAEVTVTVRKK